mgnify:CR=1 FL=1
MSEELENVNDEDLKNLLEILDNISDENAIEYRNKINKKFSNLLKDQKSNEKILQYFATLKETLFDMYQLSNPKKIDKNIKT